jgi:glycosyltransferase involved in cell wall biosynthesis
VVLFLHNRYRVTGGEERAVEDLVWLVREHLGEDAELLERDSAALGRPRAAVALLRGGLQPDDVAAAVRRTGARVVSAHNVNPAFGWRALAAARAAGARVVLHLHNYRLVCAVGTCFNAHGEDCTRCQGRNTLPGVRLNCRGTGAEAAVYGAALALWQRRLAAQADAVAVPSRFAAQRLRELRAPLRDDRVHVVPHVLRSFADGSRAAAGEHVLVASRLAPEKGVEVAVDACARAGLPLVVAGDGPLRDRVPDGIGSVPHEEVLRLIRRAAVVACPSLREGFGVVCAEAMAAGRPVVASAVGGLLDLVCDGETGLLVPPGDVAALRAALERLLGDPGLRARLGAAGRERARELLGWDAVTDATVAAYVDAVA